MTREEALNILHNASVYHPGYLDALNMAIEALDQEPKTEHWIPVSKRLPDKNMECLVSVGEFNITEMAIYSDLMGIKNHRIFYQGEYGHEDFEDITQYVKAWMPSPKRYEEESEDKE